MTQPTLTSTTPAEPTAAQQVRPAPAGLKTQADQMAPAQRVALASPVKKRRLEELDGDVRLEKVATPTHPEASANDGLDPAKAPASAAEPPSRGESADSAASQNAGDFTPAQPQQGWQLAQAGGAWQAAPGGEFTALAPAASWSLPLALGLGAAAVAASSGRGRPQPAADSTTPVLQNVSANAALNTLSLNFNEAMGGRLPQASAFEVVQAGRTLGVSRLTASGQSLSLELADDLQEGAFTLRYTDPSTGNDELALQDASGNDAPSLWRGLVADGYIFGARLFLDANGDGQPSPDEDTGVRTALDGSFELTAGGLNLSLPLLAAGGINTDTGLANALTLRAPAGALVLNPLSTVLAQMVSLDTASGTAADKLVRATARLGAALGLPEGLKLSQYDPLSDPTSTGLLAQKAAAQVAALLTAAANTPTQAQAALAHLAAHMRAASTVNLADEALVSSTLASAGLGQSATFNATVTQLSDSLSRLAEASSLADLAQAQRAASGWTASTDSQAPTVVISTSRQLLKAGEQAVLAFTFNQAVLGFELSDLTLSNASLAELQALPGGQHFWATLTPSSTATGAIGIALAEGSYRNAQGLAGAGGVGPSGLRVDNEAPLPTLSAPQVALGVGQSTTVSLRADEALSFFKGERITAVNGTLGAWSLADGAYTASFTPTPGLQSTTGLVLVPSTALADLAGNPGTEAGLSLSIDTLPPTLAMGLSKSALKAGETTRLTLNFSEKVRSLALGDISSPDGVISELASPDQRVFTATFTPHANLENASARLSVLGSAYQDLMGNPGTQDSTIELALDTRLPTLSITSSASTVLAGQTAVLSFAFSEPVRGFALGDAVVVNGTLSALQASADGKTYTATYTPPLGFPGTSASVTVAASAYTDLGGNPGAGGSVSLTVDTTAPQVRSVTANASSNTVTLVFDSALNSAISSASVPLALHFSIVQGEQSLGVRTDGVSISTNELRLTVDGDLREGMFTLVYAPTSTPGMPQIQDLRGNAAGGFVRGIVADGYIRDASLYVDSNRNGLADASEFTGVRTGLDGSFVLPTQALTGPLMAVGGINTDTGLPNTAALTAPLGAMLLNPLTTVVQHMVSADTGTQSPAAKALAASGKLAQSLGLSLPQGMSLLSYNPLAASDAGALGVQKAAAQLATLLQLAAPDSLAQQSQLLQALAGTVAAQADGAAPLALDQVATLQTLLAQASLPPQALQASPQALSQALGSIASLAPEGGLASISQAQSSLLDRTAPAAPVVKMILPSALGLAASVTVDLVTGPSDGRSASAGDQLTLTLPDGASIVHTLTQADISASRVTLDLPNATSSQGLRAQLTDLAGNTSPVGLYAAPGGDTLELSAVLGPQIMVMLQTLANQELPLIGSLNEVASVLWEQVSDMLARIPTARWAAAPQLAPMPLRGISLEQLEGDVVLQFDDYTGDEPTAINGDEVDTGSLADPFGELGPADNDGTPQAGNDSGSGSGTAPSPDVNYTRTLVGRSSGTQYNLPELSTFWPAAFSLQPDTGAFSFNYTLPLRLLDLPLLGELGIEGAYARIDANLGAYVTAEIKLQGTLDASQVVVLDTTQSKLEFYINAGLAQGSMVGGELGPLTVIGTDINSVQADSQAQRKNTGLEGTVTIGLVDNDGTANNRLSLDAKTVGKLLNELPTNTFKLSDWYTLKASLEGRVSAQLLAQLDLSALALKDLSQAELSTLGVPDALLGSADAVNGFLSQLTGMLGIFSPQISTKLTVPVSLKYDSTDSSANLASDAKVYFDDTRIAADTVLRQTLGTGLDMLDKVMSPMYLVNDMLTAPIELWPENPLGPLIGPDVLNSWPGFVEDVVLSVVNAPSDIINGLLGTVKSKLDRNQDGDASLFESMRGMVDLYQAMALDMTRLWQAFTVLPGAEQALSAALAAAGLPPGSVSAVFEAVASTVTRPAATPGNPNPQSPMELLQGALDVTDQVLAAIDQLQGLRAQYDAAMGQLENYAQANPESALSFSLGSFVWDVAGNTVTQTHNAYAKKPIDYVYPPGYDAVSESVVTRAEAMALIYNTVKEGKASALTLSVGLFEKAGVDFSQLDNYKGLNFKGVTPDNLAAICDILNTKRASAFTTDWSTAVDADAAKFTADLDEVIQYQRLYRLTSGQGDFTGWTASSMGDTFRALGVATEQDKYSTFNNTDVNGYLYGGSAAAYVLDDMVRLQKSSSDIDSFKEIKALWELSRKIEDLGYNLTATPALRKYNYWKVSGPDKASREKYFLSFDDFETLGLPILSNESKQLTQANILLRDWVLDNHYSSSSVWETPWDYADQIDHVGRFIQAANDIYLRTSGVAGSTLAQTTLNKIMTFAEVSNGGNGLASGLSLNDFRTLGIKNMTSVWLPLFSDLLATANIGPEQVNSVTHVQGMADALQIFASTVNDQTVDAKKFHNAMKTLLGNTPVEKMEFIPRAHTGGMTATYSTDSLPLLQSVLGARSFDEVDSYRELSSLFDLTEKILLTSMSDASIWKKYDTFSLPAGRSEEADKNYGSGYSATLTADELKLLGFESATPLVAQGLSTAIKQHNATGRTYKFNNYQSFWTTASNVAELGEPLTMKVLGRLVGDSSQDGFLAELIGQVPWLKTTLDSLAAAGFKTPFLSDPALLQKLWMGEPVDFLTFDPDLSRLTFNPTSFSLLNLDLLELAGLGNPVVKAPLQASAEISVVPRLSFGVDSGGMVELAQLNAERQSAELSGADLLAATQALLNGFYIRDEYFQGGSWVDLPELDINFMLSGLMGLQIGSTDTLAEAYGQISAGLNLGVSLDLANADESGKVRLADLFGDLLSDPLSVLNVGADLDLTLAAKAGAALRLPENNDSLLGFLGAAAELIYGAREFKWGPTEVGGTFALIDSQGVDAPSLAELMRTFTAPAVI